MKIRWPFRKREEETKTNPRHVPERATEQAREELRDVSQQLLNELLVLKEGRRQDG